MSAEGFHTKPHEEKAEVQDKHAQVTGDLVAVEAEWLAAQGG